VTIAVRNGDKDIAKGGLQAVSPDEVIHALLLKIASDIDDGVEDDRLHAWAKVCLTVSFIWKDLPSDDDKFWESVRLREHLVVDYNGMARSAIQRVFELAAFRSTHEKRLGKLSHGDVLRLYRENVDFAKTGEEFTENFVKNAALVHAGLLQVREVHDALLAAEESWGKDSPFNSVLKLMLLLNKVRDIAKENPKRDLNQQLLWVILGISDMVHARIMFASELGKRQIQGEAPHCPVPVCLLNGRCALT
jgi:hypothetical protein